MCNDRKYKLKIGGKIIMNISVYSNKGFVRKNNEDALFFAGNIISGCSTLYPLEVA